MVEHLFVAVVVVYVSLCLFVGSIAVSSMVVVVASVYMLVAIGGLCSLSFASLVFAVRSFLMFVSSLSVMRFWLSFTWRVLQCGVTLFYPSFRLVVC